MTRTGDKRRTTNRGRRAVACLAAAACLLAAACQQQMAVQPSTRPDEGSTFFRDGRGNRPLVEGTVPRGHLRADLALYTGLKSDAPRQRVRSAGILGLGLNPFALAAGAAVARQERYEEFVDEFPFPVTRKVMQHGQDRFMIFCVVCHDPLGTGHGKIVERGYTEPPSFHIDRLRNAPVGHFFDVITNGYGSMPEYKQQVPPRDRWAIVAYIRALQHSQHWPAGQLTPEMRREWDKQKAGARAGGEGR